ncbi:unnamed protein product [Calicophoron daubneyi]|uniref:Uncharacterized protein n=1 Tax=Calicophoron daubneyi TaxID=300641 RepID=A0AAV2T946_CALDB
MSASVKTTTQNPSNKWLEMMYENKLYRTPQTPRSQELTRRERAFILDSVAVSHISDDNSTANPKVGSVIPVYNAQLDPHAKKYFKSPYVKKVLNQTGQKFPGTCIDGSIIGRFAEHGAPAEYLRRRNVNGCGRSVEVAGGHAHYGEDVVPMVGYNGPFGYRRNTPKLRKVPSSFGVVTDLPLH